MNDRRFSVFDRLITQLDQALHTVCGPTPRAERNSPAAGRQDVSLTASERDLAGRLMRINHGAV